MKWIVLAGTVAGLIGLGLCRGASDDLVPVISGWGVESSTGSERMVVLLVPDGAIVVRALTRSEWASFQVRAEAWEWIECQMMAAAVVAPALSPSEAAALPKTLSDSVRRAIDAASGFAVFGVP